MPLHSVRSLTFAFIALAAVNAAPARAATTTIAGSPQSTTVSAYRDVVAWSSFRTQSRRYRLMARVAGRVRELPIRGRGVPFDVDLGPGPRGGVVAVYSRCRREPDYILPGGSLPQPNYSRGAGCDIYRYSFATRRETRVAAVSGRGSSEYMPSIWGRRIAFARVYERRRGRAGVVTWVYTRRLSPGARSIRAPAGRWGFFDLSGALELPRGAGGAGVVGIDLRARRLALAWEYWQYIRGPADPRYEILLDTLGGGQRRVASLTTPEIINNALFGPSLEGSELTFGGFDVSKPPDYIVRYSIGGRALAHAGVAGNLVSQSAAGSATFTVRRTPAGYVVEEQPRLSFSPGLPAPAL